MGNIEFRAKLIDGKLNLPQEIIEHLNVKGVNSLKIVIMPDIDEICKIENISKKIVEKIANTQRIPFEVAIDIVRSKGKLGR